MVDNILIMDDKKLAFEIDENKSLIYTYYVYKSEIEDKFKSILKTINSELAQEINQYFKIDIQDYNVEIDDSKPRNINKQEEEKIYVERFIKYLMVIFILFIVFVINFPDQSVPKNTSEATNTFAYIALFAVSFLLVMITGKEQFEKEKIIQYLKYNISTRPLPTQTEVIASLEDKIDQFLQKNNDK